MSARWIEAKKTKLRRAYMKRAKPMPAHNWSKPYREAVKSTALGIPLPQIMGATEPMRERTKLWHSDRMQGVSDYLSINIQAGKYSRLDMYFSGNEFFFLKVNKVTNRVVKSVVYRGRDRAMFAYQTGTIDWIEATEVADASEVS